MVVDRLRHAYHRLQNIPETIRWFEYYINLVREFEGESKNYFGVWGRLLRVKATNGHPEGTLNEFDRLYKQYNHLFGEYISNEEHMYFSLGRADLLLLNESYMETVSFIDGVTHNRANGYTMTCLYSIKLGALKELLSTETNDMEALIKQVDRTVSVGLELLAKSDNIAAGFFYLAASRC